MKTRRFGISVGLIATALAFLAGPAMAKSLYIISNINASPTPIQTYDIQGAPNYLVFQATQTVPRFGGGAVGIAIDTDSSKLFVTYEVSNTIQLLDAVTFANLGTTTAPGASNLAGIAVDQGNTKVYTVDRNTNNLYVYSWVAASNTLTLDGGRPIQMTGVTQAHGIAIDESRSRLYVGDATTTTVRFFDTTQAIGLANTPGPQVVPVGGTVDLSPEGQTVQGIAVDSLRNLLYTGNSFPSFGSQGKLVKFDLNTSAISSFTLPGFPSDNIVGLAVDEDTGNVYASTGNQGFGGTDTLIVFDSDLNVLKNDLGDIGDPTGIAIPREDISFNPLNLTKVDNPDPVGSGANLTYTICFDNLVNPNPVTNVVLVDEIPLGTDFVSATGGGVFDGVDTVTWNVGTLPGNDPQTCFDLTVTVNAPGGSTLLNRATIESTETPPTTQTELTEVVAAVEICDIDGDGDIDRADLSLISRSRGQPASGPADPRDADGDGQITLRDVKVCIPLCTQPRCAVN